MLARNRWLTALATLLIVPMIPAALTAQEGGKCDAINDGSPFQLKGAQSYIIFIADPGKKGNETPKHMKSATALLTTEPEKIKNEPGRNFLLLRLYSAWLGTDAPFIANRGTLGYTTDVGGNQNLLMAIDTIATYLEKNVPQCKAVFQGVRNKYFVENLNKSIASMKANNLDSTKIYVKYAQMLSPNDPRTWNVLTAVYNTENKADSALYSMNKVIELSGTDSLYKTVRQQARYNIAVMALGDADAANGDAKTANLAKAKGLLEAYLKESPEDANAKQALARTLVSSGDTAAIGNIFADMIEHPEKFTYIQLFEAASNAGNARRDQDAVKLLNSGLKMNPYHRDALYNLANSLFTLKDGEGMTSAVQRLVAVDPNNGNAVRLYAAAWQVRQQAEKDAAKKKVMTDSILFWLDKEKKLDPRINISAPVVTAKSYKVTGTVENAGSATASYTVKFQFLDKDGKTVASKDQSVGPIAGGSSASFTVTLDTPGIVAYKYAPIP